MPKIFKALREKFERRTLLININTIIPDDVYIVALPVNGEFNDKLINFIKSVGPTIFRGNSTTVDCDELNSIMNFISVSFSEVEIYGEWNRRVYVR